MQNFLRLETAGRSIVEYFLESHTSFEWFWGSGPLVGVWE